jgi:TolB protein
MAVWSPAGEHIVFNSLRDPPGIYRMTPGRDTAAVLLIERNRHILVPGRFSPDGRLLALTELNDQTLGDLWIYSLDDASLTPWLRTPANERSPSFSMDGQWLAYASDESGRDEVYVRRWPGAGAAVQISRDGGREPDWSPDDNVLYYRRGDAMLAVDFGTGNAAGSGIPDTVFTGQFAGEYIGATNYDVLPGRRFIMLEVEARSQPVHLDIVLNWFEELDRVTARRR